MTYQEAYDKIIDAYFKDEIEPYDPDFCFCGTLCIPTEFGHKSWSLPSECDYTKQPYSKGEYIKMEWALLTSLGHIPDRKKGEFCWRGGGDGSFSGRSPQYEDRLFAGMSAALDVLKEIHRERGEDVDNISKPFTKRQLVN